MRSKPNAGTAPTYEVFALNYASHHGRLSAENHLGDDPHNNSPMSLSFYVWVIKSRDQIILVDTGFTAQVAKHRGRHYHESPIALLNLMGVDVLKVNDIIITHMHYDHAGNIAAFPNSRLHIQEAEVNYCTGRCMCHGVLRDPFEAENVKQVVDCLFEGRVSFYDGDAEIAPGVSVHLLGGHTAGLQVVRVRTRRGYVVLASDAAHYWESLLSGRPFPIVLDVAQMLDGYRRLEKLADNPEHIIPGHDPMVLECFPCWKDEKRIAQLHELPIRIYEKNVSI